MIIYSSLRSGVPINTHTPAREHAPTRTRHTPASVRASEREGGGRGRPGDLGEGDGKRGRDDAINRKVEIYFSINS